jgi:carbonic anhydrase/acetyltransferase-like protein (isoleucine patch superfamily)
MPIYHLNDHRPSLDPTSYVAPGAQVIGAVRLGPETSVWFNAVLRADNAEIAVGAGSNIQDGAVLHVDPGCPIEIGDQVTVGHQAMIHGCSIGRGSLVGIQAILLNGVRVGENCLIGAGSLLTSGTVIPDGSLVLGRPAKVVRPLSPEEIEGLAKTAQGYALRAQQYRADLTPQEG